MIRENINHILKELPPHVTLVAVSKTYEAALILEAYESGVRHFGENKVQELIIKVPQLPNDIRWHMIGHLQRNKVKYIAPFIHLIHSVDSEALLAEIDKQAKKHDRKIDVLLEVRIAKEETKFGIPPQEVYKLMDRPLPELYSNVEICGLMGMSTFTDDKQQIADEFLTIQNLYNTLKKEFITKYPRFEHLSIGMSMDYKIAITYGSTMVRIGSSIFGKRDYQK